MTPEPLKCVVNKCPMSAGGRRYLHFSCICASHQTLWEMSPEIARVKNAPLGRSVIEYSKSMFADFVYRMEVDGGCLGGLKNIIDVQPQQKLAPVAVVKSKYMPEGH